MTTLTISKSSDPMNTMLTDLSGHLTYEAKTPFSFTKDITTITRNGQAIASIKWGLFENKLTMGGITASLNDVFPKAGILSSSRVFTTANGEGLKWKSKSEIYCVSTYNDLTLAKYNQKTLSGMFTGKKATLDISPNAMHLIDILVVTWVIVAKKAVEEQSQAVGDAAGSVASAVAG
ncbi:unnamed protein product [Rhizoctonia solani]|uniref:DUF6593 domain-containing protein n=1 Tax=Rhizoctonia solani TaxID=456999 RepID=A0A8H2W8D0_9AGAM|nr:unnamed protein product [Rhizoctonia solani]